MGEQNTSNEYVVGERLKNICQVEELNQIEIPDELNKTEIPVTSPDLVEETFEETDKQNVAALPQEKDPGHKDSGQEKNLPSTQTEAASLFDEKKISIQNTRLLQQLLAEQVKAKENKVNKKEENIKTGSS